MYPLSRLTTLPLLCGYNAHFLPAKPGRLPVRVVKRHCFARFDKSSVGIRVKVATAILSVCIKGLVHRIRKHDLICVDSRNNADREQSGNQHDIQAFSSFHFISSIAFLRLEKPLSRLLFLAIVSLFVASVTSMGDQEGEGHCQGLTSRASSQLLLFNGEPPHGLHIDPFSSGIFLSFAPDSTEAISIPFLHYDDFLHNGKGIRFTNLFLP